MRVASLRFVTAVSFVMMAACSKPISNTAALNGCYFAGTSSTPAFEIQQANLRSPQTHSTISISSSDSESTKLRLSPGMRVTDDVHKSTILVGGDEAAARAYQKGTKTYIQFPGGGFPVTFDQRDCLNS
jgi:hypothetical protein